MRMNAIVDSWRVAARFALHGNILDVRCYGNGLINETYLVTTDSGAKAILQRINLNVFPEPKRIQANLRTLLDHATRKARSSDRPLQLPVVIPNRDGGDFVSGAEGFWRMSSFIEGSESFDTLTNETQAREIGGALGRFHALVDDLDPTLLQDTLPGFHVTPGYLERFDRVLEDHGHQFAGDPTVQWCRDFIERRRDAVGVLERAKRHGLLRTRVIHGDPKFNNVLFDVRNGRALSLIDLDTVKPGLIHYDLGDCLRSCCNRNGELEQGNGDAVHFDLRVCRIVLEGYFAEAGALLTEHDVALLYEAIQLIPFELGLRFLTDYLEGNVYFKVTQPEQNAMRAEIQFDLVRSIERQEAAIRAVVEQTSTRYQRRSDV